ncbi:MAG TPA: serine/threonine-protein kinase, partial [Gemmatimonadales bacterium]
MPELQERIQAALAGEYLVEREIGRGGMAQVFLARDLRHGRLVAVKVFLPEVAEGLGKGRFLREIKTAANLNDPRILPLFDSGEGEGLLYYIMPFVDGMSLAERLAVEGQLPIEDALAIARDVALALHHAHSKGVVHRDIKPGNILLSGSKVFVADFGIAHALEETGADKLTSTGFAIGTPAYMSPEQSGGYGTPDGRADIYSLGCVLYEMLVGEPPYTGRSTHAILARHSVERAPSARAVRETVPWAVEQAIHKALAKMPADRFSTAAEFEAALAPERLTRPGPVARGKSINPVKLGVAAVGLVVLIVMLLWKPWRMVDSGGSPSLSEDMIAILPFRISGVAGSWLSQAAASASALVVQRLPDEGGHRAAFPAAVDRAIAEILPARDRPLSAAEEKRVGEAVGAGLLFEGQIAPAGNAVSIIATLVETRSGAIVARSPEVTGTADGLPAILDRVVAELLITLYERDSRDRARLLGRPLPALRAYLNGERAFARGMFRASVAAYDRALAIDSGFALAALGVASAGRFVSDTMMLRGADKARANAAALADEDLLLLEALTPPVWPNERSIPKSDSLWEAAARADSLRPTAWYHLGEALFHDGPWTGA